MIECVTGRKAIREQKHFSKASASDMGEYRKSL
jgi:hypothetical protein